MTALILIPQAVLSRKEMTSKTDIKVIRIIKRRVLGKVIPTKSIPPLIQEGAVTSTFLALARLSLLTKDDKTIHIRNPKDMPSMNEIKSFLEPIALIKILTPSQYLGSVIELCTKKRGNQVNLVYLSNSIEITFRIPLSEIIYDFFDKLKSLTKGYASYDYEIEDYQESKMIKLDINVNKKRVDALSQIMHNDNSYRKAKEMIENLKNLIPRQMFEISIQACIGSKIIASTSIRGFRKDVTAKLYGGDVTRKMKLLKKQKEGKKKMKKIGNVEIPKEAFYEFMTPKK